MGRLCNVPTAGSVPWEGEPEATARSREPLPSPGEEVVVRRGAVTLSGFLLTPDRPGPHPAAVLIHGSGPTSVRAYWRPPTFPFWKDIAEFLVAKGLAVAAFDKPGAGLSTGDWRVQSFEERARDVLAVIDYLASRPDVRADRIGVVGHSQGGWIAQMVAARYPEKVAFVVTLAGPAIPVVEQVLDDLEGVWRCRGEPAGLARVKRRALGLLLRIYARAGRVWRMGYLGRVLSYAPREDLLRVSQPFLALFAGNDRLVHAEKNARLLRQYLERSKSPAWFIEVVPGANHLFRPSDFCEARVERRWVDGFWEALNKPEFWQHVLEA